jgi:hypothetical protein
LDMMSNEEKPTPEKIKKAREERVAKLQAELDAEKAQLLAETKALQAQADDGNGGAN